jgi:hypothetical protein
MSHPPPLSLSLCLCLSLCFFPVLAGTCHPNQGMYTVRTGADMISKADLQSLSDAPMRSFLSAVRMDVKHMTLRNAFAWMPKPLLFKSKLDWLRVDLTAQRHVIGHVQGDADGRP